MQELLDGKDAEDDYLQEAGYLEGHRASLVDGL